MPKDAKPQRIELKRDDFNTELQRDVADILQERWPMDFTEFEDEYEGHEYFVNKYDGGPSSSTFQKVYRQYFGVVDDPERDDRTIEEIREEYGTMKQFLDLRDRELLLSQRDSAQDSGVTKEDLGIYRKGFKDGYQTAMEILGE